MPFIRSDMATIHVAVNAVNYPGVRSWAQLEGGDVESEDTKTRPGGMQPQLTLGGPTTRTDVTVHRLYHTNLQPYIVRLENVAGRSRMWVSYTLMNANGQLTGPTVTMVGILKTVTRPNFDANTQGAAFISLVMSCDAHASISH